MWVKIQQKYFKFVAVVSVLKKTSGQLLLNSPPRSSGIPVLDRATLEQRVILENQASFIAVLLL